MFGIIVANPDLEAAAVDAVDLDVEDAQPVCAHQPIDLGK